MAALCDLLAPGRDLERGLTEEDGGACALAALAAQLLCAGCDLVGGGGTEVTMARVEAAAEVVLRFVVRRAARTGDNRAEVRKGISLERFFTIGLN